MSIKKTTELCKKNSVKTKIETATLILIPD